MKNININKLKRPVIYGKIPLILRHNKGDHMFTGLKVQLEITDTLIDDILPQDNELIKLKKAINWEKINIIYSQCFPSKRGRSTKKTDMALGLLILKHLYRKSDRDLVRDLHLNTSYMHFCSLSYSEVSEANRKRKKVIDASTLTRIRKKLGPERIEKIVDVVTCDLARRKIIEGKILLTDTTSLEKNIAYPTEVSLLSRVIAEAALVTQNIRYKKDMVVTDMVRRAKKISKVYYSASRKTGKLLKGTTGALLLIAKDQIGQASEAVDSMAEQVSAVTIERLRKLKNTGKTIVSQVESKLAERSVAKRILSYHEEAAVSLPKSRPGKPCAFGAKLSLSVTGNGYVTDHKLYDRNIADIDTLENSVENHLKKYGKKFKEASADRAYYDKELIEKLEKAHNIMIAIPHKKRKEPLPRYKEDLYIYRKRAAIEAKISEGKGMTGMGKSYYSGFSGDRIWAGLSVLALNLRQLLKDMDRNPELICRFG
jgi:transposase, IS5 family